MTRTEKYPETKTFHYYNANPHGRITGDCTTRALSVATGVPYNDVVMELARLQCETGYEGHAKEGYSKYLESLGWVKHKQPRKSNGKKYTGKEFCKKLFPSICTDGGRVFAKIGGHHVVAIVDGKVWDIWDSTDGCIGNYWTRGLA